MGSNLFENYAALSSLSIRNGYLWTVITYAFLHHGCLHLLTNGFALYFAGHTVEQYAGPYHFLGIFILSSLFGGCLWLCIGWSVTGVLVGASAGVMGLLGYSCMAFPHQQIAVLLFFFVPVRLQLRTLLLLLFTFESAGFLFYEIPGASFIAHSAHLGGLITGVLYFLIQHQGPQWRDHWYKYFHHSHGRRYRIHFSDKK
ncbi:MAG: rhomboid family intramembrane serine protease [Puniceicoccales bacterium]|nr:rhomboid family intramembrane serine protease [Puniceicoccales bacterium]